MKARLLIIIIFLFCILAEGFAFGDSTQIKQPVGSGNAKNTDQLTAIERISNILSLAAIPVVLAVFGWIVQKRLQDQTIKRDYVQLAVSVLREQDSATASPELREWAVRLLNENTTVKFGEEVSRKLSSGETSFPSLEKFKGIPTASLTPELDAKYHAILKSFQGYLKRAGFEMKAVR